MLKISNIFVFMWLCINSCGCLGISNKAMEYTIDGNFAYAQEIMVDNKLDIKEQNINKKPTYLAPLVVENYFYPGLSSVKGFMLTNAKNNVSQFEKKFNKLETNFTENIHIKRQKKFIKNMMLQPPSVHSKKRVKKRVKKNYRPYNSSCPIYMEESYKVEIPIYSTD